jgi:hypothetical protein
MNTIICLAVCVLALSAFLAIPYILLRREMLKGETYKVGTLELAIAGVFAILTALVAHVVYNLAQGYAALYVDSVGWWTL